MASLPPGWAADYDGQRWFFTYGPTGQSQFQFPRPGDEFPDLFLYCAGGAAAAVLPAVEMTPEERLESERQVRRVSRLNAGGGAGGKGGGSGSSGEVVDEEGGLRGAGGDGGGTVCFGNFAAVKTSGRQSIGGGREEGTRSVGKKGRSGGDGVGVQTTTGVADASGESSGEPVSVPLVIKGQHARPGSSPAGSTATISIMSEPVLAVVETTPAAPSPSQHGGHQSAAVTQSSSSSLELPALDVRAVEPAGTVPWALRVGVISELYSESTALCKEEINPPPVELPGNEGGWDGQPVVPNTAVQGPVELPAYETPCVNPGKENSAARLEPKCLAGDYAATSKAGRGEAPGERRRGHDRAGLPSQASRTPSEKPLDKPSPRGRVNSAPDRIPPTGNTDQPGEKTWAERRDLTHIPSILRPGPRRSGQQRPPPPTVSAPGTNTSRTSHVQLRQQPRGKRHEEQVETCQMSHEQPARMPEMPPSPHPSEPQTAARAVSPEAPQPGGARQGRLPDSVNFVIPIRHMSGGSSHSSPDNAVAGGSPEYHVGASFASAKSPEGGPRSLAGGQASGSDPGSVPGRKTKSWGWRADEAVPPQLVGGRPAPGVVPQWSWGWAK